MAEYRPNQVCWVRTTKKQQFYPARIVPPEDLNEGQMWKGSPPLYTVIFFDTNDIHAGSAFHVRTWKNIKNWTLGIEEGLDKLKKLSVPVRRALAFIESRSKEEIAFERQHYVNTKAQLSGGASVQNDSAMKGFAKRKAEKIKRPSKRQKNELSRSGDVGSLSLLDSPCEDNVSVSMELDAPETAQQESAKKLSAGSSRAQSEYSEELLLVRDSASDDGIEIIAAEEVAHVDFRIGWMGVNPLAEEIIEHVLAKTDAYFTAVWDKDFTKCTRYAAKFPKPCEGGDIKGTVALPNAMDLPSRCEVIICCVQEADLIGCGDNESDDVVELCLLEQLLGLVNQKVGLILITTLSSRNSEKFSELLARLGKDGMVLSVGIPGCIGRSNVVFVGGNIELHQRCKNMISTFGKKVLFYDGNPTAAISHCTVYSRLMLGMIYEAVATRAFASEYKISGAELQKILSESGGLSDFQKSVLETLSGTNLRPLNRLIGSKEGSLWQDSSAMVTYSRAVDKEKMIMGGVHIHEFLSDVRARTLSQALAEYFHIR